MLHHPSLATQKMSTPKLERKYFSIYRFLSPRKRKQRREQKGPPFLERQAQRGSWLVNQITEGCLTDDSQAGHAALVWTPTEGQAKAAW